MAVKLVAVYNSPKDQAAFDHHYDDVHTPLARSVPGLSELRVMRMKKRLMGQSDIYLVAEMIFPDQETFSAAMASDENKSAGADLANFASAGVTLFIANE